MLSMPKQKSKLKKKQKSKSNSYKEKKRFKNNPGLLILFWFVETIFVLHLLKIYHKIELDMRKLICSNFHFKLFLLILTP